MDQPLTLAARTYLLACHPEKRRLVKRSRIGHLLRTAALTDLVHRGLIDDDGGKVVVTGAGGTDDPVLDGVLRGIAGSSRRKWKHWVRKDGRRMEPAIREHLAGTGLIAVEPRTVLGLFPAYRVTVRDHRAHKALVEGVARALTGSTPISRLDRDDAMLAAVAALGELDTVTTGKLRRANRDRIKALVAATGPAVPALKSVIRDEQAGGAAAAVS